MSKVIGPSGGFGADVATPFGILALCWTPAIGVGLVWAAGHTASWLSGAGWTGPAFSMEFAQSLLHGGVTASWPTTSATLIWSLTSAMAVAVLLPVAIGMRMLVGHHQTAADSLAGARDVVALLPQGVERRARSLRQSLASRPRRGVQPQECGVSLGRLSRGRGAGPCIRASWEDVVLAVMAPRAGKTTALAVPSILEAPGAVVATSNKADLWAATSSLRAEGGRHVWVFDPQRIAYTEQTWWWNPLRGATTIEEAHRLAGHFIQEVRGERGQRDFWTSAAHDLLTSLLLAASLSGRSLVDVYEWLNDPVIATPSELLRSHGELAAAASLQGRQHGAPETRDGVYETARTAAQCLRDSRIMAWVCPPVPRSLTEFDAGYFSSTRDTVYLLSKDGAGAAAPLVAALTDRIMRDATRAAERRGGRLDPPMLVVLDEAANVCRIADLPDLYSHLGSRGIVPLTILQSYRQGTRVWGELGMDALWSAATCKLIGAGLDDAKLAEDISRLVGDHDVTVRSLSRGKGYTSQSTSLRRQRILGPEAVRALPRGSALLLATGCKPAMLKLTPWYDGPKAAAVSKAIRSAENALTARASGQAAELEPSQ
jgi:type IV secretory pathway TraG/TraD family ATPase VirD4